jgi:hypothetical protein
VAQDRSRLGLLWVVVSGALAGAALGAPRADACECVSPTWLLQLRAADADSDVDPDLAAWPTDASLESYPVSGILTSLDRSGDTIDYLRASGW